MKNTKLLKCGIVSGITIIILGFLLHFTFGWSNNNVLVGTFSAINESVWEHLKILFFPSLITIIIGALYFKDTIPNYLCIKTKGLLLALLFIVIFYYTYSGILGKHIALVDISSFIIAVILAEYYTYKKVIDGDNCNNKKAVAIIFILCILFVLFTFLPPHLGIFKDPSTQSFGIKKIY